MALFYLSPLCQRVEGGLVGPGAVCSSENRGSKKLSGKGAGEPKTWPMSRGGHGASAELICPGLGTRSCQWRWGGDGSSCLGGGEGSTSCGAAPAGQGSEGLCQRQQSCKVLVRSLLNPEARGGRVEAQSCTSPSGLVAALEESLGRSSGALGARAGPRSPA